MERTLLEKAGANGRPHPAQILITAARQGRRDGTGIAAGLHRAQPINFVRQNTSRFRRLDFEGGNQQNKMQARIDREFLMPIMARDHETAEFGRSGVVGMPFQLGAKPKNLGAFERTIEERVQRVEHTEPDRYAAAKPARARHFAFDRAGKSKRLAIRGLKKLPRRLSRHRAGFDLARPRDRDEVINLQSHAEAIETGAEIRSRGGNAHRDLLLFQRKSAENASEARYGRSDSNVAASRSKTQAEDDDRLDRFRIGARFCGGKNRRLSALHEAGCLGGALRADVLVSYKTEAARERILRELEEWTRLANQHVRTGLRALFAETKRGARGTDSLISRRCQRAACRHGAWSAASAMD